MFNDYDSYLLWLDRVCGEPEYEDPEPCDTCEAQDYEIPLVEDDLMYAYNDLA